MNISKPLPYVPTQSTQPQPSRPSLFAPYPTFDPVSGAKKPTVRFSIEAVQDDDPLRDWSTEPHKLRQTTLLSTLVKVGDLTLILCPIFFLVLCILASALHEQPTQNNALGKRVETMMSLGPTIFPILFSAIAGRTVKSIAHYLAGKGEALGTLEVLMASQSTWGTFESQLLLKRFTLVGGHLLLMWALSPVGGQASLRLLQVAPTAQRWTSQVRYLDTGPIAASFTAFMSGSSGTNLSTCNSAYVASLLSPHENLVGPQDMWGNPKIPRLESLDPATMDSQGWMSVPDVPPQDLYASLVGIPIVGLSNYTTSFPIEASYMTLQCGEAQSMPYADEVWKEELGKIWGRGAHLSSADPFNTSFGALSPGAHIRSFFLDTNLPIEANARNLAASGYPLNRTQLDDPILSLTRNITFGSQLTNVDGSRIMMINCSVTETHVEANATCGSGRCAVTSLRKSLNNTDRATITPLDGFPLTETMFLMFPVATGFQQFEQSSPTEYYIKDSSISPYGPAAGSYAYTDLITVSPKNIALRLGTLINTYYQASISPTSLFGGLPTNLSLYGPPIIRTVDQGTDVPIISRQTSATVSKEYNKYVCNYTWLSILVVAALLLLLWGLLGLSLRLRTRVPEVFGYVSSMTYHNQHLNLPRGGPLDGMERAQALKGLRVKLADVRPDETIGEVALVSLSDSNQKEGQKETGYGELRKSKLYL